MDDWQGINLMKASRKWILQRVSALIVAPLIVWFLVSLISLSTGDYNSVINFFSKPLFLFLTIILLIAGFFHAKIGLGEIFEDYIHKEKNQKCRKSFDIFIEYNYPINNNNFVII